MKRIWFKSVLWFVWWSAIGLAFASQLYLSRANIGQPVSWSSALKWSLADWYVFALLAIPATWLSRRFPLEKQRWAPRLLIHLAASAVFSIAWMILRALVQQWQTPGTSSDFVAAFSYALVATFAMNVLVYWVIVSVTLAISYYSKYQEREVRTVELERRLVEARLHALQMQLNPHFLFNSLNAISSLVHTNAEAADRMISRLSDLLRYSLDNREHEVPLQQELDFLERYLEIEQIRFGPRLTVQKDIASETLAALVPNLILQPLVENAIKHGIEPHSRPGIIRISASRNGRLVLEVRDNGKGLNPAQQQKERIGIANTRARLAQLYPSAHRFEMNNLPEGGLCVRLEIPWHGASDSPALPSKAV